MTGQALPRLDRRLVAIIWIAGAAFALDLAFWHEGILRTRLANSTLVGNATSFAFAGWGYIIARRLPSRTAAMALTLAFLGLVLLMSRSYQISADSLYGDLLCLVAALFYKIYLIAIGTLRGRLQPMPTLSLATVAGAAVAFIVGRKSGGSGKRVFS